MCIRDRFCTATEAAGISAVYAAVIGLFVYKELTFKTMIKACANTARSCGEILVLVAAAKALGWMLIRAQVPQMVTGFIADNITSQILFLLLVNIVLLIMGMFMEGVAAIIIVAPLIYPAAVALGVDPVSYTHLDVYKRQHYKGVEQEQNIFGRKNSNRKTHGTL